MAVAALNFMDDEWSGFPGFYSLEYMCTTVDIVSDPADSTTANYVSLLTGAGYQFVMQWIHSTPAYMHIYGPGEGFIDIDQIANENHQGTFFNLFNCAAARFTEDNLATTYLTRTGHWSGTTTTATPTTISGDVTRRLAPPPGCSEWPKDQLREILTGHTGEIRLGTFEEYQAANPSFFD